MAKIKMRKLKCLRCGYEWYPRKDDVRQCPNIKCHSALWDVPKINKALEVKREKV